MILFVQDNAINESVALTEGARYLCGDGTEAALLLTDHRRWFRRRYPRLKPRLIVLSIGLFNLDWARRVIAELRNQWPGVPIVATGLHPSFYPAECRDLPVDRCVRGEPERPLRTWLQTDCAPEAEIPGLVVPGAMDGATPFAPILDDLSLIGPPMRELYWDTYPFIARFPLKRFVTGRGCLYECTFCYNPMMMHAAGGAKTYHRRKPVDDVIEEIHRARRYPLSHVHFSDDLFSANPDWLRSFLPRYGTEFGIPFSCNVIGAQLDPGLIRLMAEAGCTSVSIGVETADEHSRKRLLKKPVGNRKLEKIAEALHEHGIKFTTFNLSHLPFESPDDMLATIDLSRRLGAAYLRMTRAVPMPGTELADNHTAGLEVQEPRSGLSAADAIYYLHYWLFRYPRFSRWALHPAPRRFSLPYKIAFGLGHAVTGYGFFVPRIAGFRYFLAVGSPSKYNNYFPGIW